MKLFETYRTLSKNFGDLSREPESLWINTLNLGMIEGGTAANEVPENASMIVDIRIVSPTTKDQLLAMIESSLQPGVSFELIMEGYPCRIDEHDPYLEKYVEIIEKTTGQEVLLSKNGGGTDGRYFSNAGMPVIVHQANGGNCQTDQEYVEIPSLYQLKEVQKEFIRSVSTNQ